jgi:predicted RNA methylase
VRTIGTGACTLPGAKIVVLDSGYGHLTLTAADAASPNAHVISWTPSNEAGLTPLVRTSVAHAQLNSRVTVCSSVRAVLRALGNGPRACAVVFDWVPRTTEWSSMHLAGLADLLVGGAIDGETVVLPAAIRVHIAAVTCPSLALLTTVNASNTLGIDMTSAFHDKSIPGSDFWASQRPTSSSDLHCGSKNSELGRWTAESTALMHFAPVAIAASRGWSMPSVRLEARVPSHATPNALAWWHDVVLDDNTTIAAPLSFSSRGSGLVHMKSAAAHHLYADILSPVVPSAAAANAMSAPVDASWVVWPVDVSFSSSFILSAALYGGGVALPPAAYAVWHVSMLNDIRRNSAYAVAISSAVASFRAMHRGSPGPVVLELGAGAGLLAAHAAQAGASIVYALEASQDMVPRLRSTVAVNGFDECVRIIPCHSSAVRILSHLSSAALTSAGDIVDNGLCESGLAAKADVLVHELFDFSVTGEGALPSVADAIRRLVKDGARVLPARVTVHCVALESRDLRDLYNMSPFVRVERGRRQRDVLHVEAVRTLPLSDTVIPVNLNAFRTLRLTPVSMFYSVNFSSAADLELLAGARHGNPYGDSVRLPVVRGGVIDAVATWFTLDFDSDAESKAHEYSTSPEAMELAATLHWYQAVQILPSLSAAVMRVDEGDVIVLQPHAEMGPGGFTGLRAWASVERG